MTTAREQWAEHYIHGEPTCGLCGEYEYKPGDYTLVLCEEGQRLRSAAIAEMRDVGAAVGQPAGSGSAVSSGSAGEPERAAPAQREAVGSDRVDNARVWGRRGRNQRSDPAASDFRPAVGATAL